MTDDGCVLDDCCALGVRTGFGIGLALAASRRSVGVAQGGVRISELAEALK